MSKFQFMHVFAPVSIHFILWQEIDNKYFLAFIQSHLINSQFSGTDNYQKD